MANVKLTAFERADLKASIVVRGKYIDSIIGTFNYFTIDQNEGNVAWARSRNYAVKVKRNPNMLTNDSDLMNVWELTLIGRQYDFKDDAGGATLEDQFFAYMAAGNKWGALNDDFYASKNAGLEM